MKQKSLFTVKVKSIRLSVRHALSRWSFDGKSKYSLIFWLIDKGACLRKMHRFTLCNTIFLEQISNHNIGKRISYRWFVIYEKSTQSDCNITHFWIIIFLLKNIQNARMGGARTDNILIRLRWCADGPGCSLFAIPFS